MIFIDRSVPKAVAMALQCVRDDVEWLEPRFRHDTPDIEWLQEAGRNGWLVILRDKKIRTRPAERQMIVDAGVGCFVINAKQNPNKWQYLRLVATHLDMMQDIFENTPRPFIWTLGWGGLAKKSL